MAATDQQHPTELQLEPIPEEDCEDTTDAEEDVETAREQRELLEQAAELAALTLARTVPDATDEKAPVAGNCPEEETSVTRTYKGFGERPLMNHTAWEGVCSEFDVVARRHNKAIIKIAVGDTWNFIQVHRMQKTKHTCTCFMTHVLCSRPARSGRSPFSKSSASKEVDWYCPRLCFCLNSFNKKPNTQAIFPTFAGNRKGWRFWGLEYVEAGP